MLTWQWVAGSVVLLKSVVATMQCSHLCISGLFVWRSNTFICVWICTCINVMWFRSRWLGTMRAGVALSGPMMMELPTATVQW